MIWLEKVKREHENLFTALDRSLNFDIELEKGVQLICALSWYLGTVGDFKPAQYWLEKALTKSEKLGNTPTREKNSIRCRIHFKLGVELVECSRFTIRSSEEYGYTVCTERKLFNRKSQMFNGDRFHKVIRIQ